jgi:hypothetical protein
MSGSKEPDAMSPVTGLRVNSDGAGACRDTLEPTLP